MKTAAIRKSEKSAVSLLTWVNSLRLTLSERSQTKEFRAQAQNAHAYASLSFPTSSNVSDIIIM